MSACLFGSGGQQPKLSKRVREQKTGSLDVEKIGTSFGELSKEIDNVEIVEQTVDQADDRGEHARVSRGRVNHCALLGVSIGFELESAVQDVACDIGCAAAGGVGVRAYSHKRFRRVDLQLSNDHASGLADLGARKRIEFGPRIAARVGDGGSEISVKKIQEWNAGEFGGSDGTGQVLVIKPAGPLAEKIQGSDVFTGNDNGHREDAPDVVGEHRGPESGPATIAGIGKVDDEDRPSVGNRIEAWTLPQGELQLVECPGGVIARAQRCRRRPSQDQGYGGRVDVEQIDTRLAQTVGGTRPALAIDRGAQLLLDRHSYPSAEAAKSL